MTDLHGYGVDGKPLASAEEAARLLRDIDTRRVASSYVGKLHVSTVCLVLDHQWQPGEPPLIFETMTFGGDEDTDGMLWARYSTLDEALEGHQVIVVALEARAGKQP